MRMPQLDQLSTCPGCGEPCENGDRFCGACGTDLRVAARGPRPGDGAAGPAPTEPDFPLPPPQPPQQAQPPRQAAAPPPPLPLFDPRTPAVAPQPAPQPAHPADPRAAGSPRPQARPEPEPTPADPRATSPSPAPAVPARLREDAPVPCPACGAGRVGADGYCEECGRAGPRERDHMEEALGGVAAVTDLGLRHHRNEDAFAVSATALPDGSPAVVAVVCDGVSSASRPDEASATAAEVAQESLLAALPRGVSGQQAMHDALLAAAAAVAALGDETTRVPGRNAPACTIVSAITTGGTLTVGWVGDSRVYWVPADESAAAARLTEDDSWAAQMVAAGLLSEADAMKDHRAHAITAWLGADAGEVEPHTASFKPDRPGVVIVCTDGLWNYAEAAEDMARLLPDGASGAPLASARGLVRHALDAGGHDNVTVAVIPFPVAADRAGTA